MKFKDKHGLKELFYNMCLLKKTEDIDFTKRFRNKIQTPITGECAFAWAAL